MTPVPHLFIPIVAAVSTKLLAVLQAFDPEITGVHYLYGHPLEIIETLTARDKVEAYAYQKYPLIALFQDLPEDKGREIGVDGEITLHMIIARGTTPSFRAPERYDKNFIPVLYPVYYELLNQINIAKVFMTYGISSIRHTKIDRLYWGREGLWKNEGNVFNDFLDCIELRDLKLKVDLKHC